MGVKWGSRRWLGGSGHTWFQSANEGPQYGMGIRVVGGILKFLNFTKRGLNRGKERVRRVTIKTFWNQKIMENKMVWVSGHLVPDTPPRKLSCAVTNNIKFPR